jgi:hypothetical protein
MDAFMGSALKAFANGSTQLRNTTACTNELDCIPIDFAYMQVPATIQVTRLAITAGEALMIIYFVLLAIEIALLGWAWKLGVAKRKPFNLRNVAAMTLVMADKDPKWREDILSGSDEAEADEKGLLRRRSRGSEEEAPQIFG